MPITPNLSSGPREKIQDVIEFEGALKLINWLPGNSAKDYRGKATNVIKRYIAGDETLVMEIEANAASDNPINQFARASAALIVDNDDRKRKRIIEDIELEKKQLELEEKQLKLEEKKLKLGDLASRTRMRNANAQVRENEAEKLSLELRRQQAETDLITARQQETEARALKERVEMLEAALKRAPKEWSSKPDIPLALAKFLSALINSKKYMSGAEMIGRVLWKRLYDDFVHFLNVQKSTCVYMITPANFNQNIKFVGGAITDKPRKNWLLHYSIIAQYLQNNGTFDSQITIE